MQVVLAAAEHLENLSVLFDLYRVFYQQTSDLESAKKFLYKRLQNRDSVIFVVNVENNLVGFTQLYPSFSSVSMKRVWILNDLFVQEVYRNKGVARLLMEAAENYAKETKAVRIVLATQIANTVAQKLYESRGYLKDEEFYHYTLRL
ncbi:GNAT family N-acetyltransferase [Dendronalium sp. ChiSLP03b]|uniref:GNAT family N-acetyltransferase n=1 Tax=Dendronalium sp. ChiSLP03b TaxID=3075381 RepID=UPI002AD54FAE|nr:GNAT family N-acetyltransferase [Dendronalium sp. ChiSLP03b]MDZ8209451.1 GNAT family N-acetyltransferase [Dendronalium sp. ChiSLP03b]